MPSQVLWAWERPEDLRWLPANVGVAYVATTITLEADSVRVTPRANPLYVRGDTPLMAVVHVDASWRKPPTLDALQRHRVVDHVLAIANRAARPGTSHIVQLDFEVRQSQRAFLAEVVRNVRNQLPSDTALSMTALASWCAGDYWLESMAADEVVPMAFRMGRDDAILRAQLNQDGHFSRPKCSTAVGTATDEPALDVKAARQYHFSPIPWTASAWHRIARRTHPIQPPTETVP
jgi:hypothetical protein